MILQGSYWSWKTWKVMEFDNLDSRPGKSWIFCPGHGKSWNLMLANVCMEQTCLLAMFSADRTNWYPYLIASKNHQNPGTA